MDNVYAYSVLRQNSAETGKSACVKIKFIKDENCRNDNKLLKKENDDISNSFTEEIRTLSNSRTNFLNNLFQIISDKDRRRIFAEPVREEVAPNYSNIIQESMDLLTINQRIATYTNISQLLADSVLMCQNALIYNTAETVYYKVANQMLGNLKKIFSQTSLERVCGDFTITPKEQSDLRIILGYIRALQLRCARSRPGHALPSKSQYEYQHCIRQLSYYSHSSNSIPTRNSTPESTWEDNGSTYLSAMRTRDHRTKTFSTPYYTNSELDDCVDSSNINKDFSDDNDLSSSVEITNTCKRPSDTNFDNFNDAESNDNSYNNKYQIKKSSNFYDSTDDSLTNLDHDEVLKNALKASKLARENLLLKKHKPVVITLDKIQPNDHELNLSDNSNINRNSQVAIVKIVNDNSALSNNSSCSDSSVLFSPLFSKLICDIKSVNMEAAINEGASAGAIRAHQLCYDPFESVSLNISRPLQSYSCAEQAVLVETFGDAVTAEYACNLHRFVQQLPQSSIPVQEVRSRLDAATKYLSYRVDSIINQGGGAARSGVKHQSVVSALLGDSSHSTNT